MSILVNGSSRVLVQGITGRVGAAQTAYMQADGTQIVAGVTPGKAGAQVHGVPVFDTVADAVAAQAPDVSVLFVPPKAAEAAATQAIEAGIPVVVLITEGVPVHATMRLRARAAGGGAQLIGPATPGLITPGGCKVGIMPGRFFTSGPVGVISRSGTLSYEVSAQLSAAGLGQSTVVGLGADPVVGTDAADLLARFAADEETRAVVLVGEVGGTQEERAARYVSERMHKPVVAYIAGRRALPGVAMGHAGALVRDGAGTAEAKAQALRDAGVAVADRPGDVVHLVEEALAPSASAAVHRS